MSTRQQLGDLFAPVVNSAAFHQNFSRILGPSDEPERQVLRDWANGFEDRDGKFVKEFQTSFNSSFWELYVFACLKRLDLHIDMTHPRPDFLVDGSAGSLALEAVVALNPEGLAPEWVKHTLDVVPDRERLLDLAALRLAQGVQAKSEKWLSSYAQLPHCSGRAFVICIAPFEQPLGQRQGTQAIARVLFGEPQHVVLNESTGDIVVGSTLYDQTFKPSGAPVRFGLFRDARIGHVAGVLFSSLATWSKVRALTPDDGRDFFFHAVRLSLSQGLQEVAAPRCAYREELVDGLQLFLNPFATKPLETEVWRAAGVGIHRLVGPGLTPDSDIRDGMLVMRT
ncbi:MAG: hypothetical protein ABW061_04345, partial [Polyangiaceae bacterium]